MSKVVEHLLNEGLTRITVPDDSRLLCLKAIGGNAYAYFQEGESGKTKVIEIMPFATGTDVNNKILSEFEYLDTLHLSEYSTLHYYIRQFEEHMNSLFYLLYDNEAG